MQMRKHLQKSTVTYVTTDMELEIIMYIGYNNSKNKNWNIRWNDEYEYQLCQGKGMLDLRTLYHLLIVCHTYKPFHMEYSVYDTYIYNVTWELAFQNHHQFSAELFLSPFSVVQEHLWIYNYL